MFVFNDERLRYLLGKLKVQFDNKINKEQYIALVEKATDGALQVVADGTTPLDKMTQIEVSEANKLKASGAAELTVGDKVNPTYADKILSEAVFTEEEKEALKYLLENGSIDDILDKKLDEKTIVVLDQEEYDTANKDFDKNLYIIVDSDENGDEKLPVLLELDKLLKSEDINDLLDSKVDREVLSAEVAANGTHEVVANDKEPFDFNSMIKISNPALNGLNVNTGDKVNITEKVLTDFNYTEEDDKVVELMKNLDAENFLLESDIVKSFPIDESVEARKVLAATLGKELETDYLSSKKYRYVTQAEYDALFDADGNFIGTADPDAKDIVYRIKNAKVLYGLSEEQMLDLKAAYVHTLIDESALYASKDEIYDARESVNGTRFSSLSERLLNIDNMIKKIINKYNIDID